MDSLKKKLSNKQRVHTQKREIMKHNFIRRSWGKKAREKFLCAKKGNNFEKEIALLFLPTTTIIIIIPNMYVLCVWKKTVRQNIFKAMSKCWHASWQIFTSVRMYYTQQQQKLKIPMEVSIYVMARFFLP